MRAFGVVESNRTGFRNSPADQVCCIQINEDLHQIKGELNPHFPMGESEIAELYGEIQSHLEGIYSAENEALSALKSVVESRRLPPSCCWG